MSPERFQQIRDLFERAIELSPEHRRDFLARSCGEDRGLAEEVQRMLAADTGPPDDSTIPQLNKAALLGFSSGTILAQRYRIVHLLGRGGMGEVYWADDLLLGQPVALKFLPRKASADAALLARFRNEVRMARQVTHPNVCRVHDLGEADGLTYLTMEYVDGEDLGSLLRRIGKLPQDKALEVARKIAAGLTAAHEKGVVHRDLKPANIMLDGKGQIRITDFGLAGVAEQIRDPRSGTPGYMSPEQRGGREVTSRSDIYALGIVLHELFTGKRPSRESRNTDLDPAMERAIYRCLEEDPRMRPATALAAVAALPGGDPLGAALAAGEIPSPEVVANAGAVEGRSVRFGVACLATIITGLALFYTLQKHTAVVSQIPMENSPEVLAAQARALARSVGHTERSVDSAFGWEYDADHLRYIGELKDRSARIAHLGSNRPPAVYFWYRESPRYLYPPTGQFVTRRMPSPFDPGMLEVVTDSEGRLIEFRAQPPAKSSGEVAVAAPDWSRLFAAAALDPACLTPAQPVLTPPASSDSRAAWTGSSDNAVRDRLKIEAAGWQGRPVFFRILWPWSLAERTVTPPPTDVPFAVIILFFTILPIGAGLLARRNIRLGRGDNRGAFRLASFAFLGLFVLNIARQHHIPTISEGGLWFTALRDALVAGLIFWVFYMAFEPYVRMQSPATLISWSRLLAGRVRDPLVGADLLLGLATGVISLCIIRPFMSPWTPLVAPQLMATTGAWLSLWCWYTVVGSVGGAVAWLFLLTLCRLLVRLQWIAILLFIGVGSLIMASPGARLSAVLFCSLIVFSLTKLGLLSTAALLFANSIAGIFPPPTNPSAWYFDIAVLAATSILVLAVYAFHTALAGRPLWPYRLIEV